MESNNNQKYPINWDLSDIYKDSAEWQKDYERALRIISGADKYKGTLNSVEGIYSFVKSTADGKLTAIEAKLGLYVELGTNLDTSDPEYQDMQAQLGKLSADIQSAYAFADEEIFSMPLEKRKEIFSDPMLAPYAYCLRRYTDPETVVFSEETQKAMAKLSLVQDRSYTEFLTLTNLDKVTPDFTMPDGTVKRLDDTLLDEIRYGGYEHDVLLNAEKVFYSATKPYINTFASVLNTKLLEYYSEALLQNKSTVLDHALKDSDIERNVFDNIIALTKSILPDFHRFCKVHKRGLGVDTMCYNDTLSYVSKFSASISYDDAVDEIRDALSVLGSDYIAAYDKIIGASHIDVYAKDNKTDGGFMTSCGDSHILPYVLLNFSGYANEASTIAHEMGHAVYGFFSEHSSGNNRTNNMPTIFTHEVASTCNEFLYFSFKMERAETDDERLFYLENILTLINSTVIRQIMYTEFEQYLYAAVESGRALNADALCEKWIELNRDYYGESVTFCDNFRYRWAAIPHFYYGYYVYKYATSATYSSVIAQRILHGSKKAVSGYRKMLKAGSAAKPSELLKLAGVDPLDENVYSEMKLWYKSLVDEYESLIAE